MSTDTAPFIVVGAGQAGVQAAEALRALDADTPILLLGAEPHGPYHRPPLSKAWLAGEMDGAQLAMRTPEMLARKRIELRTGVHVAAIDRAARLLRLADGGTAAMPTERSAQSPHRVERPTRPTPDRFLDVLQATPAPAVQRLPQRFATLARAVTGGTDVVVRHDSAARAALAAVGKRAATIGSTIVLPERPGASTDIGVLAHELTHVAHPSPVPRFYADDHDSAEERQADAVAQLIRRSPTLRSPSSTDLPAPPIATSQLAARSTSNAPVLGAHRQAGIVRQLTPPPPRLSAPSVAPPARAGGGMGVARKISSAGRPTSSSNSSSSSGTVRRSTISSGSGSGSRPSTTSQSTSAPPSSSGQQGVVRRSTAASAMAGDSVIRRALATGSVDEAPAQQQQTTPLHDLIENLRSTGGVVDFVDWLVEQVEDRVVAEIQRRGGRYREDF